MGDVTAAATGVAEQARQEADAYRGDNPRALGGHLAVLGVYGTAVSVMAVIAAATRRRLPERWCAQDLITVALGTHSHGCWRKTPSPARLVAGSFTALAGADFLQLAYAMTQRRAEE